MRQSTRLSAGVAALAWMLLAAGPARGAPAWLAPVDLAPAGDSGQVAVDARGNAVAVWRRDIGGDRILVQSAVRPAGGEWQAPVDLFVPAAGESVGSGVSGPDVVVDPAGNAVAVWSRTSGSSSVVQGAVRPAGGDWQAPVTLSAQYPAYRPQVAVDPQGNAIAIWGTESGGVQSAVRAAGADWQPAVRLSAASTPPPVPQVALDSHGDAVAVWLDHSNGSTVQGAVRPVGGDWQAPVTLGSATWRTGDPQVAVDPQGNAVAVWLRAVRTFAPVTLFPFSDAVQAAVRPAGGAWEAPVDISGEDASGPQVAVDPQGNAIAVWQSHGGGNSTVQGAARAADGKWQPPVDLSASTDRAGNQQVAFDPQGNAIAVWLRRVGSHLPDGFAQAAVRPAGEDWRAAVDISAVGGQRADGPRVAVDPQGNAVAVWSDVRGMHGAAYDLAGPLLGALSVPVSGVAGQPVAFSLSPFDVWSAPGATTWTFGDRTAATGTAVTHTYKTAGTYTVGVTATDALDNATRTTTAIAVRHVIVGLRVSPSLFRAARTGPTVATAALRSTARVSYTLHVMARVRFTIQRARPGRRIGPRCEIATRSNRRRAACVRFVRVLGSFTRIRSAGSDRFTFTARLAGRALQPGRYRLVATPIVRGRIGAPTRASFRIVR